MVTVKLDAEHASVENACELLGIADDAIDRDFGVIEVSPGENLYTVLVEATVAEGIHTSEDTAGPFSNPRIEPFGPPQEPSGNPSV